MKKTLFALLCLFVLSSCGYHPSKKTLQYDAEYTALADSLRQAQYDYFDWHNAEIAEKYGVPRVKLMNELKEHPERKAELQPIIDSLSHAVDSLMPISNARYQAIIEEVYALGPKYESLSPEAFKGVFMRRHSITREVLDSTYKAASRDLKRSPAGKAIKEFLHGPKVWPGDKIITFDCFDKEGKPFDWSIIEGKKTVIVSDGLACMTHGMDDSLPAKYFNSLKNGHDDDMVLIIFFNNQDVDGLKENIEHFGLEDFIVVGDEMEFSSPLELMYDCQVTPSLVYINPDGTLDCMTAGVTDYLEEFLER